MLYFHAYTDSRAMNFLRTALLSGPSESLIMPQGFSILLDKNQQDSNPVFPVAMATGHSFPRSGNTAPSSQHPDDKRPARLTEELNLLNLVNRLLPLITHNRQVYAPHYSEIIDDLLRTHKADDKDDSTKQNAADCPTQNKHSQEVE